MKEKYHEKVDDIDIRQGGIVVIDMGGQYVHLIAEMVRKLHVFSRVVPLGEAAELISRVRPSGVIISGGPRSVCEEGALLLDDALMRAIGDAPVLGICYGHQALAQYAGLEVAPAESPEYGTVGLTVHEPDHPLMRGLETGDQVLMSHSDEVVLPPGGDPRIRVLASTDGCRVAAAEVTVTRPRGEAPRDS